MAFKQPVGPSASARKYDLLTAMGTLALSAPPGEQRLILRLMVAITARYNWASDTLAVAQTDLARLWSVDPRTVKRAMAQYRQRGWLFQKRAPGRGRVGEYGLSLERLMQDTSALWPAVGSDFVERLSAPPAQQTPPRPQMQGTVVPFPVPAGTDEETRLWPLIQRAFDQIEPAQAQAWLGNVTSAGLEGNVLVLNVPGRFRANYLRTHLVSRLLPVAQRIAPQIATIQIND
jgi:hypothetical protein